MNLFGTSQSQPKRYVHGTHRARAPEETLRDYAPLMPRMGITRLANVTGLDVIGLPVFLAVRPNSRSGSVSQGKGFDLPAARASALMESIEIWHAEWIDRPLKFDSYLSLRKSVRALNPAELPLASGRSFRPSAPLLWVEGFELMSGTPIWVPYAAVTQNSVHLSPDAPFVPSSNGLASGNHPLEATLHGLCEVIERDAVALWSATDDATLLDQSTIDDPLAQSLLARLDAAGVDVAIWDVTSDVGVPAYACSIFDKPGHRSLGVYGGYGCHLSPDIALIRALTEACQSRLTLIAGSRDDVLPSEFAAVHDKDGLAEFREDLATCPATDRFSRPSLATDTFEGDIAVLLDRLRGVGLDRVIAVDLSKPDLGIPVVKVLVPGLETSARTEHEQCEPGARLRAVLEREAG